MTIHRELEAALARLELVEQENARLRSQIAAQTQTPAPSATKPAVSPAVGQKLVAKVKLLEEYSLIEDSRERAEFRNTNWLALGLRKPVQ